MPSSYIISDLHFGHANVFKFSAGYRQGRTIEEHDAWLLDAINSTCNEKDQLWVLGDVAFSEVGLASFRKIRAQVRLLLGNHDQKFARELIESARTLEPSGRNWAGCLLSHHPLHPLCLAQHRRINLHGHLHQQAVLLESGRVDPRYINLSVEQLDAGKPINVEVLRDMVKVRKAQAEALQLW
ncbi:metallophosphoesterase family protein [Agarivorans gilvus]|uniref:Metallophosphatase n=1 Tax=Agarivorans gilvus TaxID=680279 RepID=A0ABQ1I1J3_9ALTE|nr:metallophosphoesterase family protein [Agarivorans gilvus]GGB05455.1 metallophosphatase [Agarivorans gilvus]